VEGEVFTAQTVALVQGMDELYTLRVLRQELAVRHRLVREQGEIHLDGQNLSRYRFAHILFQQHMYQGLGDTERRLLHCRVGEALEWLYKGRLEEVAAELARHFAGDPDRERRYARLAGERAAAQYTNEEAVHYLSRALELTPSDERREQYELLLAREKVHDLLGQRDAQRQDLAKLKELADGLSAEEQAEVLVRLGHERRDGAAHVEAWRQFEAALELARASGNRRLEAQALEGLGRVRFSQGDYAGAEKLWHESLALAQEAGDEALQAVDTRELGNVMSRQGRPDEARHWVELSRALSEKNGDRHGLANALRALGHVARDQVDWDSAERHYRDALAVAEEIGDRRSSAAALAWLGNLAASEHGALAEARAYCERSKAIAEEIGARFLLLGDLRTLSSLACQEGLYDKAEAYQKQAIDLCRDLHDPGGAASAQARLGYVLVLEGRQDAGWALLVQGLRDAMVPELSAQVVPGIVAVVGQTGVRLGRFLQAAELLGLGLGLDPKRSRDELFAKPELDMVRAVLGTRELEAALARGVALDLDHVVAEILACETPEAYWGSGQEETAGCSPAPL
jgi:tetratricopeptide (TPR) repeat protein